MLAVMLDRVCCLPPFLPGLELMSSLCQIADSVCLLSCYACLAARCSHVSEVIKRCFPLLLKSSGGGLQQCIGPWWALSCVCAQMPFGRPCN